MVIDDLYVLWAVRRPSETDPVLIVDSNAVLPFAITLQGFESVSWRDPEILKDGGGSKSIQLLSTLPPEGLR